MTPAISCKQHGCSWVWFRDGDLGFCPECFPGREEEEMVRQEKTVRDRIARREPTDPVGKETVWKPCRIVWRIRVTARTLLAFPHPAQDGVYRVVVCEPASQEQGRWLWYRTNAEGVFALGSQLKAEHVFLAASDWLCRVDYGEGGQQ